MILTATTLTRKTTERREGNSVALAAMQMRQSTEELTWELMEHCTLLPEMTITQDF